MAASPPARVKAAMLSRLWEGAMPAQPPVAYRVRREPRHVAPGVTHMLARAYAVCPTGRSDPSSTTCATAGPALCEPSNLTPVVPAGLVTTGSPAPTYVWTCDFEVMTTYTSQPSAVW